MKKYALIMTIANLGFFAYQTMVNRKANEAINVLMDDYSEIIEESNDNYDNISAIIDCLRSNDLLKKK